MAYFIVMFSIYQFNVDFYVYMAITLLFVLIIYMCYNLYKKVKIYESWSEHIRDEIYKLQDNIKETDSRGLFANDDDVGFVYTEISTLIKEIDIMVNDQ